MSFTALYDACVLYPQSLRDLLIRLGQTGLFRARWTEKILDEAIAAIVRKRPELAPRLVRTRELMNDAIRDVLVSDYESLIASIELKDLDDRHVVAAAIKCGAQVIVTFNVDDFPRQLLDPHRIEAQHPDQFVRHLVDLDAAGVLEVIRAIAAANQKPPKTVAEVLDALDRSGLVETCRELRALVP